jgi:hypothetical protein
MIHTSQYYPSLLALDTWLDIADLLSKGNLNSLCRTSRYFLNLLRPRLYREVYLSTIEPPLEAFEQYYTTLELLASDPNLAGCVHEFHVHGPYVGIAEEIDWIPDIYLRAIKNMPSLKKLDITGSIIRTWPSRKLSWRP